MSGRRGRSRRRIQRLAIDSQNSRGDKDERILFDRLLRLALESSAKDWDIPDNRHLLINLFNVFP